MMLKDYSVNVSVLEKMIATGMPVWYYESRVKKAEAELDRRVLALKKSCVPECDVRLREHVMVASQELVLAKRYLAKAKENERCSG
jgi:hypothetical protein